MGPGPWAILTAEDLDGLATALYTVGGPVRMDGLFEAYAAAAGTGQSGARPRRRTRPRRRAGVRHRSRPAAAPPGAAGPGPGKPGPDEPEPDEAAELSAALETLADLAVVELAPTSPPAA